MNTPTNDPSGIHLIGNIPVDAHNTVHIDTSKPIPFSKHAFGAGCYDTYGCKVLYNGRYEANYPEDVKQISSASLGDIYPDNMHAGTIGIRNFPHFPPPAEVTWRSKDGQPHHALVDLDTIFKDGLINATGKRSNRIRRAEGAQIADFLPVSARLRGVAWITGTASPQQALTLCASATDSIVQTASAPVRCSSPNRDSAP